MPIIPNNPNWRAKYDAYQILSKAKCEPLQKAIEAANQIIDPNDRCHAWLAVCSFVYAKPKQPVEISGTITLEQVLAAANGNIAPQIAS